MDYINWNEKNRELREILTRAVESGEECACQLVIRQNGNVVCDLAAGWTAPDRKTPITQNTLFPVFSCGKAFLATAMHRLAEKGCFDYDTPVGDLWPEFACNGKEHTLVRHILSHRAGLYDQPHVKEQAELADWDEMCRKIAAAAPACPPGTKCVYHALSFAWLTGEIMRRVMGLSPLDVLKREVFEPAGIDSMYFGTDEERDRNFVPVDSSNFEAPRWCGSFIGDPAVRHGFIPSANGVGNARALAALYGALLDGKLLQRETIDRARILCRAADDPLSDTDWAKFGLGYALCGAPDDITTRFGHGGALGAEGFVDLKHNLALGFTKNKDLKTHPVHPVRDRISAALGLTERHW